MKRLLYFIYLFSAISFAQPCDLGYELNGTNDFIRVPNTTYINSNNTAVANRTIETWFKVDDATSRQVVYEEGAQVNAILLYVEGERFYCGALRGNGSSAEFFRSANGDILDDTWYHVAFVVSTSGGTTTFLWYLDGVLQDSQTAFSVPKHTGDISLGRNGGNMRYPNCGTWSASSVTGSSSEHCTNSVSGGSTTRYYFDGNLWGFRIWNSGRTSTEINDNMDSELTSGINLVAYLDDDDVEYLNSSGTWTTASANGNGTTYTWSATANSTSWTAPGNWQGSNVPSTTKLQQVIIPTSNNYPSISTEIKIGRLDLSSASSEITIQDGGTLNVYYDATNSGTVTIENNGAFILQDNEAVSGTGTFIINRDTPDYPRYFYSIWSTPVAEADSQLNSIFTNSVDIYEYDASQNPSAYVQKGGATYMEVGKSYFIRSDHESGVLTRTFSGAVNNGCIDETIYHNSATDNFNVIGNPYPSAVNWDKIYEDNSDVLNGTMYYWSQSFAGVNNLASDWIDYNLSGSSVPGTTGDIAAGQGISVKSSQSGTITFKNTQRVVGSNDQFFRSAVNSDDGKSWFRLTGPTNVYSPILIGFIPEATDGYENSYDGEFINEGVSIEFYSLINDDKYSIQGRSELQSNQLVQVPIGFQATTTGDYTISKVLDYIDASFDILLEDTLLNTITDLRTADYTFNISSPVEDNNRFIIHYNYGETLSSNEFSNELNSIKSYFLDDTLISLIDDKLKPLGIQLFDMSGREILNTNYADKIKTFNLSSGIYIAKYSIKDLDIVAKKVIKK